LDAGKVPYLSRLVRRERSEREKKKINERNAEKGRGGGVVPEKKRHTF